ncbi:sensor domain-containing diguanylate cyclase [Cognaticolwellia beringensis]|uniref:Sensor domain-containing diguanylate cyclase n=1 Tax=Cognaticolwellia beringensis TaxID=1967665 RepID=A0A222GCT9_9GAMM|nr:sensor domain-containing diguanylate cyclase [Cognaticolwellia beringensis]ASP49670.1 sensor domain-containing diguanylate cyclase [Cognaticolwellia beringensis]
MTKPKLPEDEQARNETLKLLNILDTQQDERFDRLTRMAQKMFNVPIAVVSLVDEERIWFKSCVGLPVREAERDISFCGHAILGREVFIVPNTLEDERFYDNPWVIGEPKIRFYAGCPLQAPNGSMLGTLCIIDSKSRQFDENDIQALSDLAATVELEISALQMATVDELTNISNRRGFLMLAEQIINSAIRYKTSETLLFFDLDKFKSINDNYGHAEGDSALITFANTLKSTCRDSDVFARLGGDEFAVLLTNTTRLIAEEFVQRFKGSLDQLNSAENREYDITFSHGIVTFDPEKHATIEELLEAGDALMFKEKHN